MAYVLIPVKDQVLAKSRLSGVLAPDERRSFNHAMLQDVLEAITNCTEIEKIVLVSDDPAVTLLADKYSAELFSERHANARNLNEALGAACDQLSDRCVGKILIVHSDMPLLRTADVEALLLCGADEGNDVVLGPDLINVGTNAMLFSAAERPSMLYGRDSFSRFKVDVRRRGLSYAVVRQPGIGQDVDTAADLLAVFDIRQSTECGRQTADFLSRPEIVERLSLQREAGLVAINEHCVAAND
jgi:2-phospho-L-lactate guanylyltransferase